MRHQLVGGGVFVTPGSGIGVAVGGGCVDPPPESGVFVGGISVPGGGSGGLVGAGGGGDNWDFQNAL